MPRLAEHPVHLSHGEANLQPRLEGPEWFAAYAARYQRDGAAAWLVTQFEFAESWDSWEVHPEGDEVVVCTAGRIVLVQEREDGSEQRLELLSGDYAVNASGIWHTADLAPGESATCLFMTCGQGTAHRPR